MTQEAKQFAHYNFVRNVPLNEKIEKSGSTVDEEPFSSVEDAVMKKAF